MISFLYALKKTHDQIDGERRACDEKTDRIRQIERDEQAEPCREQRDQQVEKYDRLQSEYAGLQGLIDDAAYDHAMGETAQALAKLTRAAAAEPASFDAWHALAEIHFSERRLDEALSAAQRAHALRPDDLFINTTLSRIWMEKGDKPQAEHFGAQARIQGWKEQLKNPPASGQAHETE